MKRILLSLFLAFLSLSFATTAVEAKRLGGGGTSGLKRTTPNTPPPTTPTPAKPAATPGTPAAPAAPAAAAPKRSWMGPIAGLAAGLGIAALMSHFGMGEAMGNILTMLLLGALLVFAVRFLVRRFGPGAAAARQGTGLQYAGAGASPAFGNATGFGSGNASPRGVEPAFAAPVAGQLPAGFDVPAFERIAKLIFIRMQAANDAANLEDLRQFSTPEMFATFRLDLQDRQSRPQHTDVVQLDAQVLDFAQEPDRQVVSVRFHGLVREETGAVPTDFDEIWHLVKPADGSREWAIAGIAQNAVH